jgi:hypothetical protein
MSPPFVPASDCLRRNYWRHFSINTRINFADAKQINSGPVEKNYYILLAIERILRNRISFW